MLTCKDMPTVGNRFQRWEQGDFGHYSWLANLRLVALPLLSRGRGP